METVILAGGRSTRIKSINRTLPKPMLPFKKRPFLEYQIDLLRRYKLIDIILCVGYQSKVIKDHFGDGRKFNVKIKYSDEGNNLLGTAGAIKKAEPLIKGEYFCQLDGDTFLPNLNFYEPIKMAMEKRAKGVLVITNRYPKYYRGNICLNKNRRVTNYSEYYQDKEDSGYIDSGFRVLQASLLKKVDLKRPAHLKEILHPLIVNRQLWGYNMKNRFYEIGIPEAYYEFKKFIEKNDRKE